GDGLTSEDVSTTQHTARLAKADGRLKWIGRIRRHTRGVAGDDAAACPSAAGKTVGDPTVDQRQRTTARVRHSHRVVCDIELGRAEDAERAEAQHLVAADNDTSVAGGVERQTLE